MGGSWFSRSPVIGILLSNTPVHVPMEAFARDHTKRHVYERWRKLRCYSRENGWSMACIVPGSTVLIEESFLSRCASRSECRKLIRDIPIPAVVVWRMGRSSSRWSFANDQWKISFPATTEIQLFLGLTVREGRGEVSTERNQINFV